jgi:nucleotide-binding universal stress UspA family protein
MTRPRVILAATDFSAPAKAALAQAVELARQYEAELHIVHVFSLPTPLITAYEFGIPEAEIAQARKVAQEKLDACAAEAAGAGVSPRKHLLQSPTDRAITDLASEIGADWIVVGTHGHTGFKHALLGSVAERVVRHAPCSVLVARSEAE